MVPLIDIVFLLLVFFIYAMLSMVVHRGLKVELPVAGTAQVDRREFVSVTITRDNVIYVDDEPVSLNQLPDRVASSANAGSGESLPIFIDGDRGADFGVAVQALDRLRGAGFGEVFITSTEEEK